MSATSRTAHLSDRSISVSFDPAAVDFFDAPIDFTGCAKDDLLTRTKVLELRPFVRRNWPLLQAHNPRWSSIRRQQAKFLKGIGRPGKRRRGFGQTRLGGSVPAFGVVGRSGVAPCCNSRDAGAQSGQVEVFCGVQHSALASE